MSLPDLTDALTRIATLAAEVPKEDLAAMTAELRTLERAIRTALGDITVDVWIAGPKGVQIGYGPIVDTPASGFQIDLQDGSRVNAFATQATVGLLYSAAASLVGAIGDELDTTRKRGAGQGQITKL